SSLHAWDVEEIDGGAGPARVRFVLHPAQRDLSPTVTAEADLIGMRDVRSSNGEVESRPVIRTTLVLAARSWPIHPPLTPRAPSPRGARWGFGCVWARRPLLRPFVPAPGVSFGAGGSPPPPPPAAGAAAELVSPTATSDEARHPVAQRQPVLDRAPAGRGRGA